MKDKPTTYTSETAITLARFLNTHELDGWTYKATAVKGHPDRATVEVFNDKGVHIENW